MEPEAPYVVTDGQLHVPPASDEGWKVVLADAVPKSALLMGGVADWQLWQVPASGARYALRIVEEA